MKDIVKLTDSQIVLRKVTLVERRSTPSWHFVGVFRTNPMHPSMHTPPPWMDLVSRHTTRHQRHKPNMAQRLKPDL